MSEAGRLWWRYARIPLTVFLPLAIVLATTRVDFTIAQAFFYDASRLRWIGGEGWWTNEFLHTGGRWALRGVFAAGIAFWIATCLNRNLRTYRRPAAYFVAASLLCIGIVGFLKTITNVHCPWDLQEFGGPFPYVHLFSPRPRGLPVGECFPAAHSSSGYALFTLYFILRERNRMLARAGLALGLATGIVFGIAQQSRGAHFVSHDLWSLFLAWMISLTLYAFAFKGRLWNEGFIEAVEAGALAVGGPVGLGNSACGFSGPADR